MTADPTTLRALIARFEKWDGLDRIVWLDLIEGCVPASRRDLDRLWTVNEGARLTWRFAVDGAWTDAAIAFTEAVLPGRPWSVNRFRDGLFGAGIDIGVQEPDAVGEGPVGAVLVLATLKALLASAAIDDGDKP